MAKEKLEFKIKLIKICIIGIASIFALAIMAIGGGAFSGGDSDGSSSSGGMASVNGSEWQKFIEYMHSQEGNTGEKTINGEKYYRIGNVCGNLTVGYGIDLVTSGYKSVLQNTYGVTNFSEGEYIKAEYVDACESDMYIKCKNAIDASFTSAGIQCTPYQTYALISLTYNCGTATANNFYSGLGYGNAYKKYYSSVNNSQYYKYNEWSSNRTTFKNNLQNSEYVNFELNEFATKFMAYNNGGLLTNRRKCDWCIFQTGYYGYGILISGYGNGYDNYYSYTNNNTEENETT